MAEGSDDTPLEKGKTELKRMYDAGVRAVLPATIVDKFVRVNGNELQVSGKSYNLTENVYLVGFGKAVIGMATALEEKLGEHLKRGIISVPRGSKEKFLRARYQSKVVEYRESSVNNQPDSGTLATTLEIVDLVKKLRQDDTLIVLISGGGSALLCMPVPTIKPDLKLELCKRLQNSGADIKEVNIVRKKMSMVKGGGLARMAHPARVIALILSDIVGDRIDLIASGPTYYSEKAPEQVIAILRKYNLYESIEGDFKTLLNSNESTDDQSLLNAQKEFEHVDNFIIGNNILAIEAASQEALRAGFTPIFLRNDIVGHVERVSEAYARITGLFCQAWNKSIDEKTFFESFDNDSVIPLTRKKLHEIFHLLQDCAEGGIVLIGAGEPTVIVEGSGKGGRNQELALRFSLDWYARVTDDPRLDEFQVTFLSAGTDGQDGPTDAAGAFGYSAIEPIARALLKKLQNLCNTENIPEDSEKPFNDNSSPTEETRSNERKNNNFVRTNFRSMLREAEKIMPQTALANNDSYHFYSRFRRGKDLFKTGISGTNVMDLHFVRVNKNRRARQILVDATENITDLLVEHDLRTNLDHPSINHPRRTSERITSIFDSNLKKRCC